MKVTSTSTQCKIRRKAKYFPKRIGRKSGLVKSRIKQNDDHTRKMLEIVKYETCLSDRMSVLADLFIYFQANLRDILV